MDYSNKPILLLLIMAVLAGFSSKLNAQSACVGSYTLNVTVNNCSPGELVKVKMYLQGKYNAASGQMQVTTQFLNLIPLAQPYNSAPWNYTGTESIASKPAQLVDWVLVQVFNPVNQNLVETKAALLLNNGNVVDPLWVTDNAIAGVYFSNITANSPYYIAVRHRNHLAVFGQNTVVLPNSITYDFSNSANVLGGTGQLASFTGNVYALLAGDYNSNGIISVDDFNGYSAQSSLFNLYLDSDFNLDYANTVADFNLFQPNASKIGVPQIRY